MITIASDFRAKNGFFSNIFNGKNVCVVSGRKIDEELGEEIDSYDVVVRLNEFDLGYPFDETEKKYGKRTDIVFRECNDISSRRLYGNREREYIDSLIKCGVRSLFFFDGNGNPVCLVDRLRRFSGDCISIDYITWDSFRFITDNIQGDKFSTTGLVCLTSIALSKPNKIKAVGFSFDEKIDDDNIYFKQTGIRHAYAYHKLEDELLFFRNHLLPMGIFELDKKLSESLIKNGGSL